ncbi:uncharacterized protein BDZ99DRAFT_553413 [Mytilinidion resinicola]|uniref:Uncharacterized protein n=1 Tax=Mytilinidion resinicola TaxID=574789 RepID=A0A6A6XYZ2_9PEZI|nr:uncharacterized protein BDZ99DRAFT_553413 [Mytilinidion resinicola]KAF2801508.1 hypothetical protein BDZ99DRAFT_553413 [Mytilinidion resinicola]
MAVSRGPKKAARCSRKPRTKKSDPDKTYKGRISKKTPPGGSAIQAVSRSNPARACRHGFVKFKDLLAELREQVYSHVLKPHGGNMVRAAKAEPADTNGPFALLLTDRQLHEEASTVLARYTVAVIDMVVDRDRMTWFRKHDVCQSNPVRLDRVRAPGYKRTEKQITANKEKVTIFRRVHFSVGWAYHDTEHLRLHDPLYLNELKAYVNIWVANASDDRRRSGTLELGAVLHFLLRGQPESKTSFFTKRREAAKQLL